MTTWGDSLAQYTSITPKKLLNLKGLLLAVELQTNLATQRFLQQEWIRESAREMFLPFARLPLTSAVVAVYDVNRLKRHRDPLATNVAKLAKEWSTDFAAELLEPLYEKARREAEE